MKKRIEFIDMAKGLSLLLIIYFHIRLDVVAENARGDWFLLAFGAFIVSIFFLLSGMTFSYSPDFKTFIKKKTKGYITPYFGLGIFIVFTYWVGYGLTLKGFWDSLSQLLIQRRFTTLWFLAALYVCIIIFWLICFVTKNNIKAILVISGIISLAAMFLSEKYETQLVWNIDIAFCVQFFFAVGYYCKLKGIPEEIEALSTSKKIIYAICGFGLHFVLSYVNRLLGFNDFQMFYSHYGFAPITIIAAIAGSFGMIFLCSLGSLKYISYIGKSSLVFFGLHQTVFIEMMYIIYNSLGIDPHSAADGYYMVRRVITFAFVLVGCTLMDQLISKTKLRVILGK